MRDRICENCGRWIERNEVLYQMTVIIQAEPGPEVELEEIEDGVDLMAEIEKLVREMEEMDDDEVRESTDQVHEQYEFALCPECRAIVHKRLMRRRGVLEEE